MWGSSAIWQRFWSSLWLHFSALSGRLSCKGSILKLLLFMVANDCIVPASPYGTLCRVVVVVVVVKSLSCVQFFVTQWTAAHQAPLSSTISWVCSNSGPLSWWCYLTISSSATPFSFCFQSFPALGSFPMSQFFTKMAKVLELQLQQRSF